MERDAADHVRFCPLQSTLGQKLLAEHGAPSDCSTAVLIDEDGVHTESTAILRLFRWMGFPWTTIGSLAMLVPACIRNFFYRAFARRRGAIWIGVKRMTGWGDTMLEEHRAKMLGLEEPLPPGWGFVGVEDDGIQPTHQE